MRKTRSIVYLVQIYRRLYMTLVCILNNYQNKFESIYSSIYFFRNSFPLLTIIFTLSYALDNSKVNINQSFRILWTYTHIHTQKWDLFEKVIKKKLHKRMLKSFGIIYLNELGVWWMECTWNKGKYGCRAASTRL